MAVVVAATVACQAPVEPAATGQATVAATYVDVDRGPVTTRQLASGTVVSLASEVLRAGGSGTVTTALSAGAGLVPGVALVRIDEQPVIALPGAVPVYRDLVLASSGEPPLTGEDVAQLQRYLESAGFDPGRTDGVYAASTDRAVSRFRTAAGLQGDRRGLARGEVVFVGVPTPWTVADVVAPRGTQVDAGTEVLRLSGADLGIEVVAPQPVDGLRVTIDGTAWRFAGPAADGGDGAEQGQVEPPGAPGLVDGSGEPLPLLLEPEVAGAGAAPGRVGDPVTVTFERLILAEGVSVPVAAVRRAPDGADYVRCGEPPTMRRCDVTLGEVAGDQVVVEGLQVPTAVQVTGG